MLELHRFLDIREMKSWPMKKVELPTASFLTFEEQKLVNRIGRCGAANLLIYGGAVWRPFLTEVLGSAVSPKTNDIDISTSPYIDFEGIRRLKREGIKVICPTPSKALILHLGPEVCRPIEVSCLSLELGEVGLAPNYLRSIVMKPDSGQRSTLFMPQEVRTITDLFVTPHPKAVFSSGRPRGKVLRAGSKALADPYRCSFNPPDSTRGYLSRLVRRRGEDLDSSGESLDFNTLDTLLALFASIPGQKDKTCFIEDVSLFLGINRALLECSLQNHQHLLKCLWQEGLLTIQNKGVWIRRFTEQEAKECLACFRR